MKENIILTVLSFILVLIIYEIFIVNKAKKNRDKVPVEIKYIVKKYGIDLDKINYNQLLQVMALTCAFDIALIAFVMSLIPNFIIELLIGLILFVPVIFVSFSFIGKRYRKKMKDNE